MPTGPPQDHRSACGDGRPPRSATAVTPPITPMLARLTRTLPRGDVSYEPKWDGFRCLAFVDDDTVDLRSRHDRPLARYFPELVDGFRAIASRRHSAGRGESAFVVDGEIVPAGVRPDFAALMRRLHPAASRVERLRSEIPARFVAFDLIADGLEDLRDRPMLERRARLERLPVEPGGVVVITTSTRDADAAASWLDGSWPGIDGVIVRADDVTYRPGQRALVKVKRLRTAECVVAGARLTPDGTVSSLLLGLYDDAGALRHVGAVIQLPKEERQRLAGSLAAHAIPLEEHPWRLGFTIDRSPLGRLPGSAARWTPDMEHDWVPLRPDQVVEVGFDQVDVDRFRHPASLLRWRPDRDPRSCGLEQIRPPDPAADGLAPVVGDRVGPHG
jgi:ATP-dependent DNA ligase